MFKTIPFVYTYYYYNFLMSNNVLGYVLVATIIDTIRVIDVLQCILYTRVYIFSQQNPMPLT